MSETIILKAEIYYLQELGFTGREKRVSLETLKGKDVALRLQPRNGEGREETSRTSPGHPGGGEGSEARSHLHGGHWWVPGNGKAVWEPSQGSGTPMEPARGSHINLPVATAWKGAFANGSCRSPTTLREQDALLDPKVVLSVVGAAPWSATQVVHNLPRKGQRSRLTEGPGDNRNQNP